jgi:hypothetical protein
VTNHPGQVRFTSEAAAPPPRGGFPSAGLAVKHVASHRRTIMGLGKGALLWLIGIPIPIIILLALFWR